nr:hypothetical protein [Bacillus stercoris]
MLAACGSCPVSKTLLRVSKLSFEQFVKDWIKTYSRSGVKISSVQAREKEVKHFISVWGPFKISQITKKMYQDRMLELSEKYSKNYIDGIAVQLLFLIADVHHPGQI